MLLLLGFIHLIIIFASEIMNLLIHLHLIREPILLLVRGKVLLGNLCHLLSELSRSVVPRHLFSSL
jgi:hypothetical protein